MENIVETRVLEFGEIEQSFEIGCGIEKKGSKCLLLVGVISILGTATWILLLYSVLGIGSRMNGKHGNAPVSSSSSGSGEDVSNLRQQVRVLMIALAVLAVIVLALLIVVIWMAASFSDRIDENEDDIDAISATVGLGASILGKERNGFEPSEFAFELFLLLLLLQVLISSSVPTPMRMMRGLWAVYFR